MVDNFDLIRSLLQFDTEDQFYVIQILKRRKDNPGMRKDSISIKTYSIENLEYFDNKIEEIKTTCEQHNARAYILLNRRSHEGVAFQTSLNLHHALKNKNYRAAKSAYDSACGTENAEKNKKYAVDIDTKDLNQVQAVIEAITDVEPRKGTSKLIATIPTKNGYHLITEAFNKGQFKKQQDLDISDTAITLLYIKD